MTYSLFSPMSAISLPPVNISIKTVGIACLFALLIHGCARYPSSFEDCNWQASFPARPEVKTIFEGRIIRKQRAQVEYQGRLYRASCTIWKKHPKKKETDQRWVNRVKRCMEIMVLDTHTEHFPTYTLTHLVAKDSCRNNAPNYYWLDSYFNGHCRYVLIYRQLQPKIEARGLEFLRSVKWKSGEKASENQSPFIPKRIQDAGCNTHQTF